MLHAGLGKKKHKDDDDGEPETKEERKQRKEDEKAEKHEEHKEKSKERKHRLKKDAKKGAKTAVKGAKYLPLILSPCRIAHCYECELDAYLQLGGSETEDSTGGEKKKKKRAKAEKEKAKKAKKPKKAKKEEKPKKAEKERDERKEKVLKQAEKERLRREEAKRERAERKERALKREADEQARREAEKKEEEEREAELLRQAELAREFRLVMNKLGQDERRALNAEIDDLFGRLRRAGLADLESLALAANARRTLIVRLLAFHRTFVANFNTMADNIPGMQRRVAAKATMELTDEEYAGVWALLRDTLDTLNRSVPPRLPDEETSARGPEGIRRMARAVDDATLYLVQRVSDQRAMVETHDAALVQMNAQALEFASELGFERFAAYIHHLNDDYAFIFAPTLEDFHAGLMRAHNIGNPVARRKEQERRAQREAALEEAEEEDSFSISEEESTFSTSDEEEEEEAEATEKRPKRVVGQRQRLPRVAKDAYTVRDKRREIERPILYNMQGMKDFFNLETTNYLIELVRVVNELPDTVSMPELAQFHRALEVFQLTTSVLGARYDAVTNPDDWVAYYLEEMVDETYRQLRLGIVAKKQEDAAVGRVRSRSKKAGSATTGQEERSSEDDDDERSRSYDETSTSAEDDEDDGAMVVEKQQQQQQKKEPLPVKEKRLKDKEQVEKKDALVGDDKFVETFAATLFRVVNGNDDASKERAAWDPRPYATRVEQTYKRQNLRTKAGIAAHARKIITFYDDNVKHGKYASVYIDATKLKAMIDAAHEYIAKMEAKGQKPVVVKKKEEPAIEEMAVDDDDNTTTASSTAPKKGAAAGKGKKGKKGEKGEEDGSADSPLEKLSQKMSQLMEQALTYHRIALSLAELLVMLQIMPADYVLQKQDPFLRWADQKIYDDEESSDAVDLDDDDYKRRRAVVPYVGQ